MTTTARGARWAQRLRRAEQPDAGTPWQALLGVYGAGALLLVVFGRNLWFAADDWSFVLWHDAPRLRGDHTMWLNQPLNGHWVAVPQLVYTATSELFGLSHYWLFLAPALVLHVVTAELVRRLAIRAGATPVTALVVAALLLVLGSSNEYMLWGPVTSWQYSLVALLATLLLVDAHAGLHWRHAVAAVVLLVGVASSGYGVLFLPAVALALLARRRWLPALVVVGPGAVAALWWWATWGQDQSSQRVPGPRVLAPQFAVRGVETAFAALTGVPVLTGLVLVATLWFGVFGVARERAVATVWPLVVAVVTMYVGLGLQRIGFGVAAGGNAKYAGMGATLLAPSLAVTIDAARGLGPRGLRVAYGLLAVSIVVNLGSLRVNLAERSSQAAESRRVIELVAGSPEFFPGREAQAPSALSPDVQIDDLEYLERLGAIAPRVPATEEERSLVRAALGVNE